MRQPDATTARDTFIAFEVVMVPSVVWRVLHEGPAWAMCRSFFTARTPEELHAALADLEAQGAEG